MVTHRQTQHGVAKGGLGSEGDKADGGNDPITYRLTFPAMAGPRSYPVEGCSGRASTRTAMKVHFWNRHVRDTMVILEEGNPPPSMVHPVWNDSAVEGPELDAQTHDTVQPGRVSEETAISDV